jgi:hypothetical protein
VQRLPVRILLIVSQVLIGVRDRHGCSSSPT